MQRPNILCIMSDEHDPAVTGCYGDRIVRTPNLDQLAAQGITFDGCYCNSPLCVPSRLSFTSGKYISRVGAWNNLCWLPSDGMPSLPRLLRAQGYTPYLCGKQHYDHDRRYGFTDLTPSLKTNLAHKNGRGARRAADDLSVWTHAWHSRAKDFRRGEDNRVCEHDRSVTDTALRFLRDRQPTENPFFLFVGHLAPHFPLIVPPEIHDHYCGRVPMPELPADWFERLPLNYQQEIRGFGHLGASEASIRMGRECYWALVDWYDRELGRLLGGLVDTAVADDTIVIYTADHGENKGDHGLWWKNCMYEHGARVPLIVSWPARWAGGQRRTQVCSLVDVVQTIAALSGTACPDDWDGDSLLDLLDDPGAAWKDRAISEYYSHPIASGFAMLREGPWKYVHHTAPDEAHPAQRELYHLPDDPREWNNLADDPAQAERIASMHSALVAELGEEPQLTEARCRADYAAGYDRD